MCSFTFNFSAGEPSTLIEKPTFIPLQPGTLRLAGLKEWFILVFFFGIGVESKGHLPAEDGDGRLETLGPLGCWMIWALPVGGRGEYRRLPGCFRALFSHIQMVKNR